MITYIENVSEDFYYAIINTAMEDGIMHNNQINSDNSQTISFLLQKQDLPVSKISEIMGLSPEQIATCILAYPSHFFYPFYFENIQNIKFQNFMDQLKLLKVDITKIDLLTSKDLFIVKDRFSYPINFVYWAIYTNDIETLENLFSEYKSRDALAKIADMLEGEKFVHRNKALERLKVLYFESVLNDSLAVEEFKPKVKRRL